MELKRSKHNFGVLKMLMKLTLYSNGDPPFQYSICYYCSASIFSIVEEFLYWKKCQISLLVA